MGAKLIHIVRKWRTRARCRAQTGNATLFQGNAYNALKILIALHWQPKARLALQAKNALLSGQNTALVHNA